MIRTIDVSKEDTERLLFLLENTQWPRSHRDIDVNNKSPRGFCYGTYNRPFHGYITRGTDTILYQTCKHLIEKYYPDFQFTTIQFNKNIQCKRHRDGRNVGTSVILSVGNYDGGLLVVEADSGLIEVDTRNRLTEFNGSKHYHYNTEFTGNRYSVIFFNHRRTSG